MNISEIKLAANRLWLSQAASKDKALESDSRDHSPDLKTGDTSSSVLVISTKGGYRNIMDIKLKAFKTDQQMINTYPFWIIRLLIYFMIIADCWKVHK